MKKLTEKKAFTLVEVIVTLMIFSIIVALSSALIISGMHLLSKNESVSTEKYVGDTILDFVSEQLRYATSVSIADEAVTNKENYAMKIENGQLYFFDGSRYRNLYGEEFYRDFLVELIVTPASGNSIALEVNVYQQEDTTKLRYTTAITVRLANQTVTQLPITNTAERTVNQEISYDSYQAKSAYGNEEAVYGYLNYCSDLLKEDYHHLKALYDAASAEEKASYASEIRTRFSSATIEPTAQEYTRALLAECQGSWPRFQQTLLSAVANVDEGYYQYLNRAQLQVQMNYRTENGVIVDTLTYACVNGSNNAYLIYNQHDNAWYAYYEPNGYQPYTLPATVNRAELLAYIELNIGTSSGKWIKLS